MITKAFNTLLLLSLISVGANINMDMFDLIFFRTGVIGLFALSFFDKPKRELPEWLRNCVVSLIGLGVFNMFMATFAPVVMATTMNLFLAIIAFSILYRYYDGNFKKVLLLAVCINIALFISQQLGFDPVFDVDHSRVYSKCEGGFLGNSPRLLTFLALCIPFLPLWIIPLIIAVALYTHQLTPFLPVLILLTYVLEKKKKLLLLPLVILAVIVFYRHIVVSLVYRFNLSYKPVLNAFFDRPLLGFGLGVRPIPELETIGSSYLQFIVGVGIAGLVWFCYVFKNIYRNLFKNNIEAIALLSLAVVMIIEYPVEITRLWYLIAGIMVVFLIRTANGAT